MFKVFTLLILLSLPALAQSTPFPYSPPVTLCTEDLATCVPQVVRILVTNGSLSVSGKTGTITTSGGDVTGPASSTANAVTRFSGTTGKILKDTSALTLSDTGAFTFPDGVKQTFNPSGTTAGLNVGAHSADPSAGANGDTYYNSGTNKFRCYVSGAWGDCSAADTVTSVFGRTGAVVAASNDYTFAQIGTKPTTLAGYGITDAALNGDITASGLTVATGNRLLGKATAGSGAVQLITVGGGLTLSIGGLLSVTSGPVGGSNTQLQYNDGSAFGGISGATSNGTAVTFASTALIASNIVSGGNTLTLPTTTDTLVGRATTDTLTNKTLTTPVISSISNTGTITLPTATTTLVGTGTTDTLTNKTLTASSNVLGGVTMTLGSDANGDTYYRASSVLTRLAIGANGTCLTSNGTVPSWSSCGSATPGGSTTQMQYNNAGAFGGVSGATTDGTNVTYGSTNLRATSPRITTGIFDANGNESILLTATGSAVNELTLANSTTTNPVTLSTTGGDTNIGFTVSTKGTGVVSVVNGALLNTTSGTTGVGVGSAATEQLAVTSLSASRTALAVNSLANSTVDMITGTLNADDTSTTANLATFNTNSNGTAAAGFGQTITYNLESSTTDNQGAALQGVRWKSATHASRSSVYWIATTDNAASTERFIIAPRLALTDNVATTIFSFTLPTTTGAGGTIHATVFAMANGTDENVWSGDIAYTAANNGGAISRNASVLGTPAASGSGTMTVAFAAVNTSNTISIQVTANPTTAPTAGQFYIIFTVDSNLGPTLTIP